MLQLDNGLPLGDDERGVAQLTAVEGDPHALLVTHHRAALSGDPVGDPEAIEFRSVEPIAVPGRQLVSIAGAPPVELTTVATGGAGLSLVLGTSDDPVQVGMAFRPPGDPKTLLACWRRGRATAYGVARYRIHDSDTIVGSYISEMSPELPGQDVAKGDTTSGLEGRYVLHSEEADGRKWGPHELNVILTGKTVRVDWTEHGRIFCRGFGFVDPGDSDAFIVTYWKT